MAHRQRHRGPHPDDARLFAPERLPVLRAAAEEVTWLLGRGWSLDSAVGAVGAHHQLETRQRLALKRAVCSEARRKDRLARRLGPGEAAGRRWLVDGFNLIITLEVALSGGLLVVGSDGALRDLAGLRGSYHPVEETARAIALVGEALVAGGAAAAQVLLDAPVSSSGRLRAAILAQAAGWPVPVEVELDPDPDGRLAGQPAVVSADAVVLDRCASWINLAADVVATRIPSVWRIVL